MNSQNELLKFKEQNTTYINRLVFFVLCFTLPAVPIAIICSLLGLLAFERAFIITLLFIVAFVDIIPIIVYLKNHSSKFFTYYTMSILSVMVSVLAVQAGSPVWLMYAFAPALSCLYFNKKLMFLVSFVEYISMIVALYFSTLLYHERLYFLYPSPTHAFITYSVGLSLEFGIVCIALEQFLKRIDIYLTLQNNLIDEVTKEKDRFRIAVESTNDIIFEYNATNDSFASTSDFFIFDKNEDNDDCLIENFSDYLNEYYSNSHSISKTFQRLANGQLISGTELCFKLPQEDGTKKELWLLYEGTNHADEKGYLRSVIGRFRDITSKKQEEALQSEREKKDRVTGLYLFETIENQIIASEHVLHLHGIIMINIANYLNILQVYGHVFGEIILKNIAETICKQVPKDALVTRYDGSIFLVYIEDTEADQLEAVSEEITISLEKMYIGEGSIQNLICDKHVVANKLPFKQLLASAMKHLALKPNDIDEVVDDIDSGSKRGHNEYATLPYATLQEWIEHHTFFNTLSDLVEETKDLRSSLRMVIEQTGKYLDMDRIFLFTLSQAKPKPSLIYQWSKDESSIMTKQHYTELTKEHLRQFIQIFSNSKVVDINKLKNSTLQNSLADTYNVSFKDIMLSSQLACPLLSEGNILGLIIYQKSTKDVIWKDSDKYFIEEATRIINNAFNKLNADSASNAKTSFLSNMSHEIRTPMNAIIGMTEIAHKCIDDPARVQECLAKIDLSSHHLLQLINDILDLSKIESGRMKVNKEPLLLTEIIKSVDSIVRPQANNKSVNFIIEENYSTAEVIGDSLRLSQVLVNILGNALKFTPEQGMVTLSIDELSKQESEVELKFSISDTGIGISEEGKKKIFAAFEQAEDNIVNQYGGTGLGLAISSDFVHLMGGKLEVDSELGKGSTFYFTLKMDIPTAMQRQEMDAANKASYEDEKEDTLDGIHVLMAEDNEINAEIAQTMLELAEATVTIASNGQKAIDLFTSSTPGTFQIILMDINMPIMNGYDACRSIRSSNHADAQSIPILALTANAFDEDKKEALNAGMNGHVSKPIEMSLLIKQIKKILH